jgi:hypothetical protein
LRAVIFIDGMTAESYPFAQAVPDARREPEHQ